MSERQAAYYNEFDPVAAQWLRELIADGLIPPGEVDERSIKEVTPDDIKGFAQCHFFAGIGGWPYAARLIGWPDDRPLWTGSCPCQPYSLVGKRLGNADERDLWPDFFGLIESVRPQCVFGEQVPSAVGHGWLDRISSDLAQAGYACGAVVLGAHSVGAPHIRQRLYWVADKPVERTGDGWMGDSPGGKDIIGESGVVEPTTEEGECSDNAFGSSSKPGRVGHSIVPRLEGHAKHGNDQHKPGRHDPDPVGSVAAPSDVLIWSNSVSVTCADGKSRRVGSGVCPLADGVSYSLGGRRNARRSMLQGAGNAIVPQVAAAFMIAALEADR